MRKCYDSTTVFQHSDGFIEAVGVYVKQFKLTIFNIYRPPDNDMSEKLFIKCLENIQEYINNNSMTTKDIVLCGDFNFGFIDWESNDFDGRDVSKMKDKIQASELLKFMETYDLRK